MPVLSQRGHGPNIVLIQIWTTLIHYLLLAFIKFQTRYQFILLHFTRVLRLEGGAYRI
jgi:hypothetical protein